MLWLRLTVGGEVRSATGVKTLARQLLPAVVRESRRREQLTEGARRGGGGGGAGRKASDRRQDIDLS